MNDFITLVERLVENYGSVTNSKTLNTMFKLGIDTLNSQSDRDKIELFIKNTEEHWDRIFAQDYHFFMNNMDSMLVGKSFARMGMFKKLMTAKDENGKRVVSRSDRDNIWEFMHAFVRIALNHIHSERLPYVRIDKGAGTGAAGKERKVPVYGKQYFNWVDLKKHYTLWRTKYPDFRRHFKTDPLVKRAT